MNLVIDDAVEVRLATKSVQEKRRPLGTDNTTREYQKSANSTTQAKSFSRATMFL